MIRCIRGLPMISTKESLIIIPPRFELNIPRVDVLSRWSGIKKLKIEHLLPNKNILSKGYQSKKKNNLLSLDKKITPIV